MSHVSIRAGDRILAESRVISVLTPVAIYTGPTKGTSSVQLIEAIICNHTAGAVVVTVERYVLDALAAFKLIGEQTIPAHTTLTVDLGGIPLEEGDELRVTASVVDAVDVTLLMFESMGVQSVPR